MDSNSLLMVNLPRNHMVNACEFSTIYTAELWLTYLTLFLKT